MSTRLLVVFTTRISTLHTHSFGAPYHKTQVALIGRDGDVHPRRGISQVCNLKSFQQARRKSMVQLSLQSTR